MSTHTSRPTSPSFEGMTSRAQRERANMRTDPNGPAIRPDATYHPNYEYYYDTKVATPDLGKQVGRKFDQSAGIFRPASADLSYQTERCYRTTQERRPPGAVALDNAKYTEEVLLRAMTPSPSAASATAGGGSLLRPGSPSVVINQVLHLTGESSPERVFGSAGLRPPSASSPTPKAVGSGSLVTSPVRRSASAAAGNRSSAAAPTVTRSSTAGAAAAADLHCHVLAQDAADAAPPAVSAGTVVNLIRARSANNKRRLHPSAAIGSTSRVETEGVGGAPLTQQQCIRAKFPLAQPRILLGKMPSREQRTKVMAPRHENFANRPPLYVNFQRVGGKGWRGLSEWGQGCPPVGFPKAIRMKEHLDARSEMIHRRTEAEGNSEATVDVVACFNTTKRKLARGGDFGKTTGRKPFFNQH